MCYLMRSITIHLPTEIKNNLDLVTLTRICSMIYSFKHFKCRCTKVQHRLLSLEIKSKLTYQLGYNITSFYRFSQNYPKQT